MRTGWSIALVAAALAPVMACGSSARGTVTGAVPICYGPGPNTNLTPEVTVFVRQNGRLVTKKRFRSDENRPRPYRFTLKPGVYSLTSSSDRDAITIRVRSGHTTHADLPSPGCL